VNDGSSSPGSSSWPLGRGELVVVPAPPSGGGARPGTWSRWASSSLASPSSTGTLGTNTDAVSPGRRDRTNRPTAWAKNSGVEALVA
jgi:hypothetical protein